jgi:hypothetical protein
MVTKRFFFICAGLLCLVLAYHLGAQNARAQSHPSIVAIAWNRADGYAYAVDAAGAIFANPGNCGSWTRVGQMPAGCTPTCILDGDLSGHLDVGCAEGDFYYLSGTFPYITPVFCSSIYGGTTPSTQETWGGLKSRYRQGAGAATQDR